MQRSIVSPVILFSVLPVLAFQVWIPTQCGDGRINLLLLPLSLAFMAVPMFVIYMTFRHENPVCTTVGVAAMYPLYYAAYWADCVAEHPPGGGAAFGALLPFFYGIPVGLFTAWLTKKLLKGSSPIYFLVALLTLALFIALIDKGFDHL